MSRCFLFGSKHVPHPREGVFECVALGGYVFHSHSRPLSLKTTHASRSLKHPIPTPSRLPPPTVRCRQLSPLLSRVNVIGLSFSEAAGMSSRESSLHVESSRTSSTFLRFLPKAWSLKLPSRASLVHKNSAHLGTLFLYVHTYDYYRV